MRRPAVPSVRRIASNGNESCLDACSGAGFTSSLPLLINPEWRGEAGNVHSAEQPRISVACSKLKNAPIAAIIGIA
jgi:hypothetical protein